MSAMLDVGRISAVEEPSEGRPLKLVRRFATSSSTAGAISSPKLAPASAHTDVVSETDRSAAGLTPWHVRVIAEDDDGRHAMEVDLLPHVARDGVDYRATLGPLAIELSIERAGPSQVSVTLNADIDFSTGDAEAQISAARSFESLSRAFAVRVEDREASGDTLRAVVRWLHEHHEHADGVFRVPEHESQVVGAHGSA